MTITGNELLLDLHHIFRGFTTDIEIRACRLFDLLVPDKMDHVPILTRQTSPCLPTSSCFPNETMVMTPPGLTTSSTCIQYLQPGLHWSTLVPGVLMKRPPARESMQEKRNIDSYNKQLVEQRRLENSYLLEACTALVKQYSTLRVVQRAKKTKPSPKAFETIRPFEGGGKDTA